MNFEIKEDIKNNEESYDENNKKNQNTLLKEKKKLEEKEKTIKEEEENEINIKKFKVMYDRVKNNITSNFDSTKTNSINSEELIDVVIKINLEESSRNAIDNYLNNHKINNENSNKLKILLGLYKTNIENLINELNSINLDEKLDKILNQIENKKITK